MDGAGGARYDKKKVTWLLGGQPSLAEVVKGEKEALVILLGSSPLVKRFWNFFATFFSARLIYLKNQSQLDLETDVHDISVPHHIFLAVQLRNP